MLKKIDLVLHVHVETERLITCIFHWTMVIFRHIRFIIWTGLTFSVLVTSRTSNSIPLEGAVDSKNSLLTVSSVFCPVEIPCAALPGPGAEAVPTAEGSK